MITDEQRLAIRVLRDAEGWMTEKGLLRQGEGGVIQTFDGAVAFAVLANIYLLQFAANKMPEHYVAAVRDVASAAGWFVEELIQVETEKEGEGGGDG